MLIIRGVNVFPSQVEAALAHEPGLAPHYVLEVHRPDQLDELIVVAEAWPGESDHEALRRNAAHLIKAYIGVSAEVRVVAPGGVERSQGKAKRVIDRRPKE